MNNIDEYKIIYYFSADDECYLATIPELGGCISDGITPEEAIENVRKLGTEWFEVAKDLGWDIPEPTTTVFPEGEQLHIFDVALYILSKTIY